MQTIDLSKIPTVLATDPNVIAAWVFGSAKHGQIKPGSDLDLGVLFARKPTLDERLALAVALDCTLSFEKIDLIVLNNASTILCFEALCGHRIYSTDVETEATFQSLTAREYEHAMWMVERGLKWRQEAIQAQTPA